MCHALVMLPVIVVVALAVSAQGPSRTGAGTGTTTASAAKTTVPQDERVATIVVPTGLDDDDVKRLHSRVNAQVAAAGGKPMALSNALEVKDECLDDPSCARAVLRAADAPWLLWVDALRAGPKLQIDARLLDAEGRVVAEGGGVVDVDDAFRGKSAVPNEVLAPLRAALGTAATTTTPTTGTATASANGSNGANGSNESNGSNGSNGSSGSNGSNGSNALPAPERAQPPTALENPPPPLAIAGVVIATGGLLVSVVSLALIPAQFEVIDDAESSGDEKETAAVMVPTLASVAVGGVIVGGVGGAIAFFAAE